MKTIAFFNSKGGVGKTTLVWHLAAMFADLGVRVVAADFDPQADLTAISLPFEILEAIEDGSRPTIHDVIAPVISGDAPVAPTLYEVADRFALLPASLRLSEIEDALADAWTESLSDSALVRRKGLRGTAALAKAVRDAGASYGAEVALIDVGPNLGALNRAALLGADFVVVPVAPGIFSLEGLTCVGQALRAWRAAVPESAPFGRMAALGYVVARFTMYSGDQARHFSRWIDRVPLVFRRDVLDEASVEPGSIREDPACLAWLKDYQSLLAMAQECRKPIFHLKPADGAIGGHQRAVWAAYADFRALARVIGERVGIVGQ